MGSHNYGSPPVPHLRAWEPGKLVVECGLRGKTRTCAEFGEGSTLVWSWSEESRPTSSSTPGKGRDVSAWKEKANVPLSLLFWSILYSKWLSNDVQFLLRLPIEMLNLFRRCLGQCGKNVRDRDKSQPSEHKKKKKKNYQHIWQTWYESSESDYCIWNLKHK